MSASGPGLPDHEQRAWDAIVADLSGDLPADPTQPLDHDALQGGGRSREPANETAADDAVATDGFDEDDDVEGFQPPPPPPIPAPQDAIGRFSWAAVLGGPLLVVLATVLGWDRWLANLGIALAVGGFASLVWRMSDRDDDDDGAVV
ncbi:MAG: hypothetical protein ACYC2Z_09645 [Candidatus Nanopelagicales bacterium]